MMPEVLTRWFFACLQDEFEGRWSHTSESVAAHAQQLPLFSIVSDRDMPFNSSCGHVPVVSYEVTVLNA